MPGFPEPSAQPQGVVELPRVEAAGQPPRRMYVKRADLKTHGYTPGWSGCKALATGSVQVAHNDACRKRVASAIATTGDSASRIKAVRQRENEYIARRIEKSAKIKEAEGQLPSGLGTASLVPAGHVHSGNSGAGNTSLGVFQDGSMGVDGKRKRE